MVGDTLLKGSESVKTEEALAECDLVMLYFSAHWCGPCRHFTPKLVALYNELKASGSKFEIIFVSSDKDLESFKEYYGTMPWMSLPYGDKRGLDTDVPSGVSCYQGWLVAANA